MFRMKECELATVISPMHTNPLAKTYFLSQERTPFALIFLMAYNKLYFYVFKNKYFRFVWKGEFEKRTCLLKFIKITSNTHTKIT